MPKVKSARALAREEYDVPNFYKFVRFSYQHLATGRCLAAMDSVNGSLQNSKEMQFVLPILANHGHWLRPTWTDGGVAFFDDLCETPNSLRPHYTPPSTGSGNGVANGLIKFFDSRYFVFLDVVSRWAGDSRVAWSNYDEAARGK